MKARYGNPYGCSEPYLADRNDGRDAEYVTNWIPRLRLASAPPAPDYMLIRTCGDLSSAIHVYLVVERCWDFIVLFFAADAG
jgi:hypothetical protein